jgi:hypothetical protein
MDSSSFGGTCRGRTCLSGSKLAFLLGICIEMVELWSHLDNLISGGKMKLI